MEAQQRGREDGQHKRGMNINPSWTSQEREAYIAAYNQARGH